MKAREYGIIDKSSGRAASPKAPRLARSAIPTLPSRLGVSALMAVCFCLGLTVLTQSAHAQRQFFSDFNDGVPDWNWLDPGLVTPIATETNGWLSLSAQFPPTSSNLVNSLTGVGWLRNQPILEGQTLEYRVQLIKTSHSNVLAGFDYSAVGISGEGSYSFGKDANRIFLSKVATGSGARAYFINEEVLMSSNWLHSAILSLALTRVDDNLLITCSVLDTGRTILFQKTVVDTPGTDPTVASYPGLRSTPDPGVPYGFNGSSGTFLYLAQVTDGTQPEAEVVYDHFSYEYRPYMPGTVPSLEVARVQGHALLPDSAATDCGWDRDTRVCVSPNVLLESPEVGEFFEILVIRRLDRFYPNLAGLQRLVHDTIHDFYCYGNDGEWHDAGFIWELKTAGVTWYDDTTQELTLVTPEIIDTRFTPTNCVPAGGFPPPPEAIRLSWPTNDTRYYVVAAPTLAGPWKRLDYPTIPTNGLNTVIIPRPTGEGAQFFKLSELRP